MSYVKRSTAGIPVRAPAFERGVALSTLWLDEPKVEAPPPHTVAQERARARLAERREAERRCALTKVTAQGRETA